MARVKCKCGFNNRGGYARQADSMGVDIIQNCEVTGFDISGGKIKGAWSGPYNCHFSH